MRHLDTLVWGKLRGNISVVWLALASASTIAVVQTVSLAVFWDKIYTYREKKKKKKAILNSNLQVRHTQKCYVSF